MALLVPDDVLTAAGLTEAEMRLELAVLLFEQERLTLGQASHLATMAQPDFMFVLAKRGLPLHYGIEEFDQDLRTLAELPRR